MVTPLMEESERDVWDHLCYCEDEDKLYRINIPKGTTSDEFFEGNPACLCCGNTNLHAVNESRPENFTEKNLK